MSLAQVRKQEEEKEEKERKLISGFITFGMLVALVAVMLIFGFTYLDPPPEEQGVMVSLGQPDGGTFDDENQSAPEQTASSTPQTEESLETQEHEDAPEETSTPVPTQPKPTTPTERPKPEPPKPQANPDMGFTPSNNTPKNQGDGDKPAPGGDPTGQQGGTPGGNGIGTSGDGGDYRMGLGRKPEGKINASCNFTSNEVVVVKIKVDQNGYVKEAECVLKYKDLNATTVGEPYCKCAKQAAKSAKFTAKADAPATQEGAVKFDFRVK